MYFSELFQIVLQEGNLLFLRLAAARVIISRSALQRLLHSVLKILDEELAEVVQCLQLLGLWMNGMTVQRLVRNASQPD